MMITCNILAPSWLYISSHREGRVGSADPLRTDFSVLQHLLAKSHWHWPWLQKLTVVRLVLPSSNALKACSYILCYLNTSGNRVCNYGLLMHSFHTNNSIYCQHLFVYLCGICSLWLMPNCPRAPRVSKQKCNGIYAKIPCAKTSCEPQLTALPPTLWPLCKHCILWPSSAHQIQSTQQKKCWSTTWTQVIKVN